MDLSNQELSFRKKQLEDAREKLKQEFVGIDAVVDRVIDSLSSWYFFPHLQESPNVVCLWGLTGTGKTSLLLRLRELLELNDRFYRFDLGEENIDLKYNFERIQEEANGEPFFLSFDEFQHAKSLEGNGKEKEREELRILWDLLDSGTFELRKHTRELNKLIQFRESFDYLRFQGLEVQNGKVVQGLGLYLEYLPKEGSFVKPKKEKEKAPCILTWDQMNTVQKLLSNHFENVLEVERKVAEMDGDSLLKFLDWAIQEGRIPKTV
ncbi:MAG: hypothetical protein ABEH43_02015, partial [Flavobacteriales bacterium]